MSSCNIVVELAFDLIVFCRNALSISILVCFSFYILEYHLAAGGELTKSGPAGLPESWRADTRSQTRNLVFRRPQEAVSSVFGTPQPVALVPCTKKFDQGK
ncbi:hypothetical protein RRG08_026985 [Elysia crispata]|uniref:Uncharacterized protein n=1 Tax=Elysia crispata TaxID=231223 RepID=A0AAE1DZP9_9GAST|nr:hypothetical protein RRG08_026985 [Elysia crispata]